jgi:hypothetical protein
MSEAQPYSERETSLAAAWSRAFLAMLSPPERELSPFLVSIAAGADGQPVEDESLRAAIDACLEENWKHRLEAAEVSSRPKGRTAPRESQPTLIETVAKTIFPQAMWRRAKGDRQRLYKGYLTSLPDFVSMAPHQNSGGLYFARMIGYGVNPKTGAKEKHLGDQLEYEPNQLEFVIKACKPGGQRMALQVSIFDPVRDQTDARQHFPCLQHVTFVPDFARGTLSVNAFYALQLLYVKAYGNWLGLMRLGAFVASQTKPQLRFERLNCFSGIQKMTSDSRPRPGALLDRLTEVAQLCVGEPAEVGA